MADAKPQAMERILIAELGDDIAQPVVPAVSAAGLELGDARGHVEFVVGDQDGVRGDPEESRQRRHGLAAAVHVGSRDQQTNVLALVAELADQAEILAVSHEADALGMRQALNERAPALCRVWSYSGPGFPRPTISCTAVTTGAPLYKKAIE